ncbi:MAG: hypothetical protein Crog4KO_28650 [Crocinitomicaceae bacterium]
MEKSTCPKCNRPLSRANAWHYCQEVDIDSLFLDKPDAIVLAFDTIFQVVSEWDNVAYSATKNCIVFLNNKTFLVIKPMKKWLEVKFFSDAVIEEDRLHKQYQRGKRYEGIFRFEFEEQIDPNYFQLFRKSFELS